MRTISSHFSGPARTLSQSRRILKCEPVAGPFFVLGLVLLLCSAALGQMTVLPTTGKSLGSATAPEAGKWMVISSDFLPVSVLYIDKAPDSELAKGVMWEGDPGIYGVMYFPPGDKQPIMQRVTLGGATPTPEPQPDPPVPPGDRWAIVWEESGQRTAAQAALRTALKADPSLKVYWIDVTNLPPTWRAWHKLLPANQPLPALMVAAGDRLARVVALPASVEAVKQEVSR